MPQDEEVGLIDIVEDDGDSSAVPPADHAEHAYIAQPPTQGENIG